jgi:hypothetical protein
LDRFVLGVVASARATPGATNIPAAKATPVRLEIARRRAPLTLLR